MSRTEKGEKEKPAKSCNIKEVEPGTNNKKKSEYVFNSNINIYYRYNVFITESPHNKLAQN